MEQKIEKGIGWLEKLLKMEEKYGFFRFLRVLLLLHLTGFVILTCLLYTSPSLRDCS